MVIFATIDVLIIAIALAVMVVFSNIKKEEKEKYYTAAGNIIKEEFLNYSLKNIIGSDEVILEPTGRKIMLYLKSVKAKPKKQFVFDPGKIVYIGRNSEKNNIFINDVHVSQNHCCIYSNYMSVYIKDSNSANGTIIKRGLFGNYLLSNGAIAELKTGDKIIIGSCCFKIVLFYFDVNMI